MPTNKIIAISAPVEVVAGEKDGDKTGPAKFSTTFYTGGALHISGWDLPVVVDLAGLNNGNVLVANLDHDSSKRVGNFDVINDQKSLVAQGTATAATAARDEVVQSAIAGYRWQSSLEVSPQEVEEVKAGKKVTVNGQEFTGPLYVTRKGTLKGFAFVSHGADDNTTVSIAAIAANPKEKNMKPECETWIKAMGLDPSTLTDEQKANLESDFEGRAGKREPAPPKIEAHSSSLQAEVIEAKRREAIKEISGNFLTKYDANLKTMEFLAGIQKLEAQAIEEKWEPSKYDLELLRGSMPVSRAPVAPRAKTELTERVLQAALCQAGGLKNLEKSATNPDGFTDQELQVAHTKFRGSLGLQQLYRICARQNGYREESDSVTIDMQRAAFAPLYGGLGLTPIMGTTSSMFSLPGILGDSAYKFFLEGWGGGEMTWQDVCSVENVRDFKQITQYRLNGTMKYEKLAPGGEIKEATVSETSYTVQADTYAKRFAADRRDIINDDLRAITTVPRELGFGANESFNTVFWTEWLSGDGGFFAYTSSGVMSSATAIATIAAAETKFFEMTKPNGEPFGIIPNVMLMPNGSYRVALSAMNSSAVTGGSSAVPTSNPFSGEYRVVRSAYLSNSAYTNYSPVKWYLLHVRQGMAPIQVAFLNGQRNPTIETNPYDFNTLGVQFRGVHDFGVNLMEARTAVQGSGA